MTKNRPPEPSTRATGITKEYYTFLEDLRESGVTNMFGAGAYLEGAFPDLSSREATDILVAWMEAFREKPEEQA